ncbi:hypothetical protein [Streptomyces seoulensis]
MASTRLRYRGNRSLRHVLRKAAIECGGEHPNPLRRHRGLHSKASRGHHH